MIFLGICRHLRCCLQNLCLPHILRAYTNLDVPATMRSVFLFLLVGLGLSAQASDGRIYRCGNAYTNTVSEAQAKNCTLVSSANITVIPATKVRPEPKTNNASPPSAPRVEAAEQRAKDQDARMVLELELKKMQVRQADLRKEFNNGEPEKLGTEVRNQQKYLDRIAELKAAMSRNDSDIAGIQRELARLPGGPITGASK